jgi:hypothetical protein
MTLCTRTAFDFSAAPIPADFFAPGSEPFDDLVRFGSPSAAVLGDTKVGRLQAMALDTVGSVAVVEIELIDLNLYSCNPITVVIAGQDTEWEVHAVLSDLPPPPDTMIVIKTHDNGGTFNSSFYMQPKFIFTPVSYPAPVCSIDTGGLIDPAHFETSGTSYWVHESEEADPNPTCGDPGFLPGIIGEGEVVNGRMVWNDECVEIGHDSGTPGHLHVTKRINCWQIPTVSEWGRITLVLLLVVAAAVVLISRRRRKLTA